MLRRQQLADSLGRRQRERSRQPGWLADIGDHGRGHCHVELSQGCMQFPTMNYSRVRPRCATGNRLLPDDSDDQCHLAASFCSTTSPPSQRPRRSTIQLAARNPSHTSLTYTPLIPQAVTCPHSCFHLPPSLSLYCANLFRFLWVTLL